MNDSKSVRLTISLMSMLSAAGTVSVAQSATLLGADEEEVYETLRRLAYSYDSVGILLELEKSYARFITGKEGGTLRLTERETEVLLDALHVAGVADDDELVMLLMGNKSQAATDVEPSVTMVRHEDVSGVLELLAGPCEDRIPVAIDYQKSGAGEPEHRVIEPHRLLAREGHWYLDAFCRKANDTRQFRLDRIAHVEPVGGSFTAPITAITVEEPYTARLRFAPNTSTLGWSKLEFEDEDENGARVCTTPWLGGMWLPRMIAAALGKVEVLDPPELKDAVTGYVDSLL